ncbi:catalase-related domain-containing protein [Deinococcus cavernae]|uniref:catalase-related domain-containing protein n=1 Tax=Deinococcus cavernae TaxID=2320857 RepID=UPI001F41EAE1|nr:catalase-related domain-containing protein [Deinococcus cavernae]
MHNNQRDGHMGQTINPGRVAYFPNALAGNLPAQARPRGFVSYPEQMRDTKRRARAGSFGDHYGQAKLFWNSMSPVEREHITKSWAFELSMCQERSVRLRILEHLDKINEVLASQVAIALGEPPRVKTTAQPGGAQDSAQEVALLTGATSRTTASGKLQKARGLSQLEGQPQSAKSRKVAVLAAPGVNADQVAALLKTLKAAGATGEVVGTRLGKLENGVEATKTLSNTDPVLYDAVFIPGGAKAVQALIARPEAHNFVVETYRHAKPIGSLDEGAELISASPIGKVLRALGGKDTDGNGQPKAPVTNLAQVAGVNWMSDASAALARLGILVPARSGNQAALQQFMQALAHHRFWGRPQA